MTAPPRRLIAGGLAAMGLAMSMTALVRPGMPYRPLVVPMALFGFGFLLAQAAWNNAFLSALPAAHVGVSAGVSKAAAQTGILLGTALLGSRLVENGEADFVRQLTSLGLSSAQIEYATAALASPAYRSGIQLTVSRMRQTSVSTCHPASAVPHANSGVVQSDDGYRVG